MGMAETEIDDAKAATTVKTIAEEIRILVAVFVVDILMGMRKFQEETIPYWNPWRCVSQITSFEVHIAVSERVRSSGLGDISLTPSSFYHYLMLLDIHSPFPSNVEKILTGTCPLRRTSELEPETLVESELQSKNLEWYLNRISASLEWPAPEGLKFCKALPPPLHLSCVMGHTQFHSPNSYITLCIQARASMPVEQSLVCLQNMGQYPMLVSVGIADIDDAKAATRARTVVREKYIV
ncbi:hypothetical protein BD769DRAFT_1383985 [Suillus cothurnatus]|nr:hypothetical protein BD769DRAFT_1383985 [Suillus cothurnatus]